eukprot:6175514-Pleurochrysis_carterae.AAC.4
MATATPPWAPCGAAAEHAALAPAQPRHAVSPVRFQGSYNLQISIQSLCLMRSRGSDVSVARRLIEVIYL